MPDSYFQAGDRQPLIDGAGGVSVTIGGATANCLRYRRPDSDLAREESGTLTGISEQLLAVTGTFAAAEGVDITVEGTAGKILSALPDPDDSGYTLITWRKT